MRECEICFNDNLEDHSIVFLECTHSLCKSCYNRLLKDTCPFCRCKINREEPKKETNKHTISNEEFLLRLDELVHRKLDQKKNKKDKKIEYKKKYKSKNKSSKNPSDKNIKNNFKNKRKSLKKLLNENSSKKDINKNKYMFTKGYKKYIDNNSD